VWFKKCDHPESVEYVLAIEPAEFPEPPVDSPFPNTKVVRNTKTPCLVSGFNTAGEASTGNPLVAIADDLFPCPHWDTILAEVLEGREDTEAVVWAHNGSFWGRDSKDEIVHPILTRKYYERLGHVFNPAYRAWYADTEFAAVAHLDGVVIDAREKLRFDHRHFSEGRCPHDAINARADAGGEADKLMFEQRKAAGFP
jgi:hypothetical protein